MFWLAKPCPRWCNGLHDDRDAGPDRRHFSSWEEVLLTLEDAQEMGPGLGWQPEYAIVSLDQGVREDVPRIWCGKGVTNQGWHLTEDVAGRLAVTLTAAANLAAGEPAGWSAATAVRHHRGVGRPAGSPCRPASRVSSCRRCLNILSARAKRGEVRRPGQPCPAWCRSRWALS
ncbi:DUF6907 domain-containing protein [Amycolatopsis sp. cmx-4-83]|uniref:DUF6907 domain-containing protein n=1 Tax=Amycolatopsis sp. cmx-4-83 TaxID=2790940 RepID=UPI003979DFA0